MPAILRYCDKGRKSIDDEVHSISLMVSVMSWYSTNGP